MPIVETTTGRISGEATDGLLAFRGIPFARADRFRPCVAPAPWADVRDCTKFGPPAQQGPDALERIWGEALAPGDEDCLTINVWTPSVDGKRPVLVLIHGGAFIIGSGRWPWFDGANLARRGDLVVVTCNYRLGALGYLDLPEFPGSGNLGLTDQIAAFEWVRDNIANFGGDSASVTACGESAGSMSVCALLAAPKAKGLIHRAICMSGAANLIRTTEYARRVTAKFLKLARVKRGEDLLGWPTAKILAVQREVLRKPNVLGELFFGPVVDGEVLPEPPLVAIQAGRAADVSILAGTTADEIRLWILYKPILNWIPPGAIVPWFRSLGLNRREVEPHYRAAHPIANSPELTMTIAGDAIFWVPTIRLLEAQSRHRSDSRMYLFGYPSPAKGGVLGAPHAGELPFALGNLDAPGAVGLAGTNPDRVPVSDAMCNAWIAFARTGDPNHAGLPEWPTYDLSRRATLRFDTNCEVLVDPRPKVRAAWAELPFDSIRPTATDLPRVRDVMFYFARWIFLVVGGMAFLILLMTAVLMFGK